MMMTWTLGRVIPQNRKWNCRRPYPSRPHPRFVLGRNGRPRRSPKPSGRLLNRLANPWPEKRRRRRQAQRRRKKQLAEHGKNEPAGPATGADSEWKIGMNHRDPATQDVCVSGSLWFIPIRIFHSELV